MTISSPQRIIALDAENIKKLKAVHIDAAGKNVMVIGGRNAQGKSSLLDSIFMAIGGKAAADAKPVRDGERRGKISITTNDLVIERTFSAEGATSLTIKSPEGAKFSSPQAILDKMTMSVAFDPLAFSRLDPKKQAETLRKLVGLDFAEMDAERKRLYEERTLVNRDTARLASVVAATQIADAGDYDPDAMTKAKSALSNAVEQNTANAKARTELAHLAGEVAAADAKYKALLEEVAEAERKCTELAARLDQKTEVVSALKDADISDLQAEYDRILDAAKAEMQNQERSKLVQQHTESEAAGNAITRRIAEIDAKKAAELANANMPVDGISFDDGVVYFNGIPFEQLATSEQIRISAAIACALNPTLRVMIIKDGSLLDDDAMAILAEIATEKDVQIWIERVGNDKHTSVVIEDGCIAVETEAQP